MSLRGLRGISGILNGGYLSPEGIGLRLSSRL